MTATRFTTRILRVALAGGIALAAVACASPQPGEGSPDPTWSQYAPGETTSAAPTTDNRPRTVGQPGGPPTNERGNIEKTLGQTGGLVNPSDGQMTLDFAVTGMRAHQGCSNQFMKPPEGFKPLSIDIVVNTYNDPDNQLASTMFGQGWEYISQDGTSFDATDQMSCEYNSPELKPNRKYTTTVWVLIPDDAQYGYMVWDPSGTNFGYEWALTV